MVCYFVKVAQLPFWQSQKPCARGTSPWPLRAQPFVQAVRKHTADGALPQTLAFRLAKARGTREQWWGLCPQTPIARREGRRARKEVPCDALPRIAYPLKRTRKYAIARTVPKPYRVA